MSKWLDHAQEMQSMLGRVTEILAEYPVLSLEQRLLAPVRKSLHLAMMTLRRQHLEEEEKKCQG